MAQGDEVLQTKRLSTIIIGLLVACIILVSGVGYFVYIKVYEGEDHPREKGVVIAVGDPKEGLILNVGGVNSGRYLKISVLVELKPDKDIGGSAGKTLTVEEARIRDIVVQLLRSQKIEDFEPSKQTHLKDLIKHEIGQLIGEERVYDVYITNFIVQ